LLEVIVTDEREARLAQAAGADRLELVAEMQRGGLSPSLATLDTVLRAVSIPVHAIVRPHDLGFCYAASERARMLETAERFASLGADGLVFGALTSDGRIDAGLLREFVARVGQAAVTFHRAFDAATDPRNAYTELSAFPNVTRVLTSGAASDALSGAALLRDLIALRKSPTVLVGGGVTPANVRSLIAMTGARELHVGSGARREGRIDAARIERLAQEVHRKR
jgi:copper homeostasis protein